MKSDSEDIDFYVRLLVMALTILIVIGLVFMCIEGCSAGCSAHASDPGIASHDAGAPWIQIGPTRQAPPPSP